MTKRERKTLTRIAASFVLLIAAVLLDLEGYWRLLSFLIPYAVIGWDVLYAAVRNILRGQVFDENFLMSIATVGAMATGEYPEGVAVMLFYQVGELFQSYAVGKSRKSISELMDIRPDYANVMRAGEVQTVDPDEVAVGEVILIRPGERIPLDGRVIDGSTTVNNAALTGESLPADINSGDTVISGAINLSGVIQVEVQCTFGESTVSKILELVERAASRKAKAEAFITRFARYYTPVVVICAVLLALVPPLLLGLEWHTWFYRALVFLVVSCPCALVISVPLSFFGGIGGASRHGILVKGANYLEALAATKTVVFDKTGTLTEGKFHVAALNPAEGTREQLLEYAAYAECYSNHPISLSVKAEYGKELDTGRVSETEELAGRGIRAVVDGKVIHAGNTKLMDSIGVVWSQADTAGTMIHVAVDGVYQGSIVIADRIKSDAAEAIGRLRKAGVERIVMLTGDRAAVGKEVGAELGLDEVCAELLPADKVTAVERLLGAKSPKSTLTFVGDGINDAPVLTRADVGVAMGAMGSDAAIEAADIVLMDDKLSNLADAMAISKKTLGIVRQNIVFALGIKAAVLILAAAGWANMWLAVFADVGVSVIAILNAMRALNVPKHNS
ncbi:MAG: cadmium-translocating P-type ATPase [Oscillospiraceae bacterium]|nr:cadmium-translocating P-type ATPase [Oscillospiraceae bacterium]